MRAPATALRVLCPLTTRPRLPHRLQLEGENYLHFAQMEVYGTYGDYYKVGRVSHVAATHGDP